MRGLFLEGAWLGIRYYLYPQWEKIIDVNVWVEAAKQIYFSLGPGFGTLMALSSYNKFNHNCRRDALIAAAVNYFASFISGLVIFAVLGYMATIEDVPISVVATEGKYDPRQSPDRNLKTLTQNTSFFHFIRAGPCFPSLSRGIGNHAFLAHVVGPLFHNGHNAWH